MAEIVARVGKLTGQAIARDLDGNVRALKSGDPIREGEVVQSADGSQVQLTLTDGGQVTLNANEAAKLDAEVASPDLPDAGDSSVQNVTQIFTRVSKTVVGQDGTFSFDDDGGKGAGSAVQNEGHSFVELLRIVESVDPLAFEYGTGRGQPLEEIRGGGIWNNAATVFTFAPPETENISVAGSEDSPIRIDLKGSDPDGLVAGYAIRSLPANGLLYADAALTQLVSVGQTVAGPVYFKPNDNWNGTASFEYATVDNTGSVDETPATVTIDIAPVNDFVSLAIPDVNGGNTGQSNVVENATTTGSFTISAPDGLDPTAALTIAGTAVSKAALEGSSATPVEIATPEGKLTITGYNPVTGVVSYSYDPSGTAKDHTGGEVVDAINIVVRDNNGDTQSGTLSINILDTVPVANPDTATITEDAASDTVGGNVIVTGGGQDTLGADATSVTGVVAGIGTPGNNVAEGSTSSAGATVVTGLYGSLMLGADGSYSYRLDNTNAAVNALKDTETLSETFTYTITDADGDTSSTTLTLTINGTTDGAPSIVPVDGNGSSVTGQVSVYEAGLTSVGDTSETTTGTINVGTPDGLTSVKIGGVTLTVAELQALSAGSPQTIDTGEGTLTLTGFSGTGTAPLSGVISYTYTLKAALTHTGATASESSDLIALEVTDRGGITTNGTLTVQIVDDTPTAKADSNSVTEDANPNAVSGNVMTAGVGQDDLSADNTQVTGVVPGTGVPGTNVATGTSSVNGTTVAGQYGELKIGADGSYVYTLDNALPATQALNQGQQVLETFTYTITDADGDASNTTITVTINGTNDVPVVTNLPAATAGSVSEAGHLDDGTVVAGTATATGDLNASDVDSGATQTWGLQGTPSTTYGSMAIDSSTGVWTYTLDNNLAATQALKEGEVVTQTYTARVTDDKGAYVDQTITVTINGTNDVPVVTNLPAATA
ncbi:MAG: retention module-containing protein, partial [Azonexus sp.]